MRPVENDSTGAASVVHTSLRKATRHVGPREGNRFVSLTVLFSSSVQEKRAVVNWTS